MIGKRPERNQNVHSVLMVILDKRGGMFQYAALLANALAILGLKVSAIVPVGAFSEFFHRGVEVFPMDVGDTRASFVLSCFQPKRWVDILQLVREVNPDVVHFHNPYNLYAIPIMPFIKAKKVVFVPEATFHSGLGSRADIRLARKLHTLICDGVIIASEFGREYASKHWARGKKVFSIPHGVNTLFTAHQIFEEQEDNSILFFGNIAPFKGLEFLLRAYPLVKEKHPGLKLVVAGQGMLRELRELLRQTEGIVLDNSFVPFERAAGYFQKARAVILPYVEADHAGVLPIAYAFGKPVVATSLIDMVEDGVTGWVVPPRDHQALAEAITRLLSDDAKRKEMGMNAKKKGCIDMNWETVARKTVDAYESILVER